MTLRELHEIIAHYLRDDPCDDRPGTASVVVATENGGCPTKHRAAVRSASMGFDWDAGRFILRTEEPLVVVRGVTGSVRAFARSRLYALKQAYNRTGFTYIPKAREEEWIDGFVEGVKQHVTWCDSGPLAEPGEGA